MLMDLIDCIIYFCIWSRQIFVMSFGEGQQYFCIVDIDKVGLVIIIDIVIVWIDIFFYVIFCMGMVVIFYIVQVESFFCYL